MTPGKYTKEYIQQEYKEVRQNHGSFYTLKEETNTNKKAHALGPGSVSTVTVKHLKTGLCFLC
jgi:hypothetical protein